MAANSVGQVDEKGGGNGWFPVRFYKLLIVCFCFDNVKLQQHPTAKKTNNVSF